MKKLLTLVCICLHSIAFAQTSQEITVEGFARVSVVPDVAILKISIYKRDVQQNLALQKLNETSLQLLSFLHKQGFSDKQMAISEFSIQPNNNYQNNSKTYVASNSIKITFALDTKRLDYFYGRLQGQNFNDVQVDFETAISDSLQQVSNEKLTALVIQNAKAKAQLIAKSLEAKVGKVKSVLRHSAVPREEEVFVAIETKGDTEAVPPPPTAFRNLSVEPMELTDSLVIVFTLE